MTAIALLFVSGILLLAAEVFLPGAIAGIIGACALVLGSWLAFSEYGADIGSLVTFGALVLVGFTLYAELVWLPRSRFGRRLVIHASIDGASQPLPASTEIIGKTATALTPLVPSGIVTVEGKRFEAFSRSGQVARGAALKVIGVDNFRVIVSEAKSP
jgi:membrane-bound serine protease (ClpP class)